MTVSYLHKQLIPNKNQPKHDLVFTPDFLANNIIKHFKPSGSILEPCYGSGAFFNAYPLDSEKHWCEISKDVDFFDCWTKVDWIITNPPWSKFKEFLIHSVKLSENIVFLVTINHFMTKARMRILFESGFAIKEIYGVPTPKENWPSSGFQLAAVHIKKGWKGKTKFTGVFGK